MVESRGAVKVRFSPWQHTAIRQESIQPSDGNTAECNPGGASGAPPDGRRDNKEEKK